MKDYFSPRKWPMILMMSIVVLGLVYFESESPSSSIPSVADDSADKVASEPEVTVVQATKMPEVPTAQPENTDNPVRDFTVVTKMMPNLELYRSEVEQNVHETPVTFRRYADTVSELYVQAKNNPEAAKKLFDQLAQCSGAPEAAKNVRAVRAFCAEVAGMLAGQYPELNARWYDLKHSLPDDIQTLLMQR